MRSLHARRHTLPNCARHSPEIAPRPRPRTHPQPPSYHPRPTRWISLSASHPPYSPTEHPVETSVSCPLAPRFHRTPHLLPHPAHAPAHPPTDLLDYRPFAPPPTDPPAYGQQTLRSPEHESVDVAHHINALTEAPHATLPKSARSDYSHSIRMGCGEDNTGGSECGPRRK